MSQRFTDLMSGKPAAPALTPAEKERQLCAGEVEDLLKVEDGLAPREIEFIESMKKQLDGGRYPSEKQSKWLHSLWDRHCRR